MRQVPLVRRNSTVALLVVLLLLLAFTTGCIPIESDTPSKPNTTDDGSGMTLAQQHDLAARRQIVATRHETHSNYSMYIEGDVTNNTGKDIPYGQVTFTIYDAEKRQIGTALDNCTNLRAGVTWHFKAMVLQDNAKNYSISDLVGWYQ